MRQHPKSNNSSDMTCAADGTVGMLVPGEMGRLDHRLLPAPFSSTGSFIARLFDKPGGFAGRGFFIAAGGRIYRNHEPGGHGKPMRVSVMGRDGRAIDPTRVLLETGSSAGIRVDRAGNIYVLDHLKPVGKPVPDTFSGKAKVDRHHPFVYHYGSLLKFGPGGGAVRELGRKAPARRELTASRTQFTTAEGRGDYVSEGLLWSYYGVSMITPALDRSRYRPYNCMCHTPNFDLDDFARVFVPDQLRCRIVVLDTAGNFITSFGQYGNVDARGPVLTFADPRSVVVSREAAYVGDGRNNRIVKVRLDYRRRASCSLSLPTPAGPPPRTLVLVRSLREEVARLSPALADGFDWDRLARRLSRRSAASSLEAARAELCLSAPREMADWPESESRALLGHYLRKGAENVRAAAVWGLAGGMLGEAGGELLREALDDKSEIVRAAAAYVLLDRRDPRGLAEVFRGASSKNADVYKLAETAMLRQLLVWDSAHPRARTLDTRNCLVPVYEPDREAVAELGRLLDTTKTWYLRRAAMFLLGFSGRPEAAPPLLRAMRRPERDRNLNRCIAGLGLLRCRQALPDLVKFLARGHGPKWGTEHYNGDEAEVYAARALVRIADPECVGPVIALLDSKKPEVRKLARRTLTELFAAKVPADRELTPKNGKLVQVRVDELPAPAKLRAAWEGFWKAHADSYSWQKEGGPLRRQQQRK
jgi:HEAT repeat protein